MSVVSDATDDALAAERQYLDDKANTLTASLDSAREEAANLRALLDLAREEDADLRASLAAAKVRILELEALVRELEGDVDPDVGPFPLWRPSTQLGMSSPRGTVAGNPEGVFAARRVAVEATGGRLRFMRIFAFLGGDTQHDRIMYAKANGLVPDITYKVTGNPSHAALESLAKAERDWLADQGLRNGYVVGGWHEPYPDISASRFHDLVMLIGEVFAGDAVRTTAMTSWLLEAPNTGTRAQFDAYMSVDLFAADGAGQQLYVDSPGIDAYEEGSLAVPAGTAANGSAASRMRKFAAWCDAKGIGHLPLSVHEYNGYRGTSFDWVTDYLFNDDGLGRYWQVMLWNATGGKGVELTGLYDRLPAFQVTMRAAEAALSSAGPGSR